MFWYVNTRLIQTDFKVKNVSKIKDMIVVALGSLPANSTTVNTFGTFYIFPDTSI